MAGIWGLCKGIVKTSIISLTLLFFSSSYCEAVLASPSLQTVIPSELAVEYHLALVIYCP